MDIKNIGHWEHKDIEIKFNHKNIQIEPHKQKRERTKTKQESSNTYEMVDIKITLLIILLGIFKIRK